MKKVVSIMLMVMSLVAICSVAFADTYVRPHVRRDGSFVQGHYRSDRDNNPWNTGHIVAMSIRILVNVVHAGNCDFNPLKFEGINSSI